MSDRACDSPTWHVAPRLRSVTTTQPWLSSRPLFQLPIQGRGRGFREEGPAPGSRLSCLPTGFFNLGGLGELVTPWASWPCDHRPIPGLCLGPLPHLVPCAAPLSRGGHSGACGCVLHIRVTG